LFDLPLIRGNLLVRVTPDIIEGEFVGFNVGLIVGLNVGAA